MALSTTKQMTLIIGPCGAGKSTYLRRHYPNRFHIDQETFLAALLGGERRYWPQARRVARIVYETAYATALTTGLEVAATSAGATIATRAQFVAPARAAGYRIAIVLLRVRPETAITRAQTDTGRPKTARAAWPDIVRRWYRLFEPVQPDEYDEYQEIDNE